MSNPVLITTGAVETPEGVWIYVQAQGVGGVGQTLTRAEAWRASEDDRYLLRLWDALCWRLRQWPSWKEPGRLAQLEVWREGWPWDRPAW